MSRQIQSISRTDWQTPPEFFALLGIAVGGFAVDVAANATNALCPVWYGPGSPHGQDALSVEEWPSPAFCNPPYVRSEEWKRWLRKFAEQAARGVQTVVIIPAATGTLWWRELVVDAGADILFVTGRLKFRLPKRKKPSQPNHDSAVVVYGPEMCGAVDWINSHAKAPTVADPVVDSVVDPHHAHTDASV